MPVGSCTCAVATAASGNNATDQSNTLSAYTVSTFDPSTAAFTITNEVQGAGVSSLTFRAGGVSIFQIPSTGALTLPSPLQIGAADTGLSRDSAGVIDVGNGTQGDKSGRIKLTNLTVNKSDGTLPGTITDDGSGGF